MFWSVSVLLFAAAAVAGFAAALTRFNGVLIVLPLAWYLGNSGGWRLRAIPARRLLLLGAPLIGAAAYPLYLWHRFGDPFLYFRHRPDKLQAPWTFFLRSAAEVADRVRPESEAQIVFFASVGSGILFLLLTVLLFRRGLVAEGLYCAATLVLLFSSGSFYGLHRYVLALFPCFFVLVESLRPRPILAFAYAFGGIGVGVVFIHRFVHQIFVA